jgi:type IV pilus assembly protein PilP
MLLIYCRLLFVLLPVLFVSGCANSNLGELQSYVAQKKAAPPGRIESIPEYTPVETYLYNSEGRRNPFMDINSKQDDVVGSTGSGLRPDFNRAKEELENYSLDSIRMVGTVEQNGITWGLVKTKDGTVHKVKSGNRMGQNYGQIVLITENRIELRELVQEGSSDYTERQASLALAE